MEGGQETLNLYDRRRRYIFPNLFSCVIFRSPEVVQALKDLECDGVAVVHNVMTNQECDSQVQLLRDWLKKFGEDKFPKNVTSIIHGYGIGHCETAWECRLKAKPIFAQIYGTDKLHTSFDGLAISQPPEGGKTKFAKDSVSFDGLHHDQGPRRVGFHAIQGLFIWKKLWKTIGVLKSSLAPTGTTLNSLMITSRTLTVSTGN